MNGQPEQGTAQTTCDPSTGLSSPPLPMVTSDLIITKLKASSALLTPSFSFTFDSLMGLTFFFLGGGARRGVPHRNGRLKACFHKRRKPSAKHSAKLRGQTESTEETQMTELRSYIKRWKKQPKIWRNLKDGLSRLPQIHTHTFLSSISLHELTKI